MRKFLAKELDTKPFLYWVLVPSTTTGPLVVNEADIPENQFGVSPWKIVDGELVNRSTEEMEAFEAEYIIQQASIAQKQLINVLEGQTFTFEGKDYPVNLVAIARYRAIESDRPESWAARDITGEVVNFDDSKIDAFISAMNKVVIGATL